VPIDGCPANGSSVVGVKIRTSYDPSPVTTGNVVSDSFISSATACMSGSGHGSSTTHRPLPANGRSLNTSTMT